MLVLGRWEGRRSVRINEDCAVGGRIEEPRLGAGWQWVEEVRLRSGPGLERTALEMEMEMDGGMEVRERRRNRCLSGGSRGSACRSAQWQQLSYGRTRQRIPQRKFRQHGADRITHVVLRIRNRP
jgi:hypothetical protein